MFQLSLVLYPSGGCLQPLGKVPGSQRSGGLWLCPGWHLGFFNQLTTFISFLCVYVCEASVQIMTILHLLFEFLLLFLECFLYSGMDCWLNTHTSDNFISVCHTFTFLYSLTILNLIQFSL
jgi:hypothetical protein